MDLADVSLFGQLVWKQNKGVLLGANHLFFRSFAQLKRNKLSFDPQNGIKMQKKKITNKLK